MQRVGQHLDRINTSVLYMRIRTDLYRDLRLLGDKIGLGTEQQGCSTLDDVKYAFLKARLMQPIISAAEAVLSLLSFAAINKDVPMCKLLFSLIPDVADNNLKHIQSALSFACESGNSDMVRLFL